MRQLLAVCVLFACGGFAFVTVTKGEASELFPFKFSGSGIRWLDDLRPAALKAAQSKRPLLIYISSANCVYCRKMERETWAEKAVVERVNDNYIAVKLDAGRNRELVQQLRIRGFPTTVLLQADGSQAVKLEGFSDSEKMLSSLAQYSAEDSRFNSPDSQNR